MHRLKTITINNLKSIKSENFPLSDFTPLIGYNNAGKTNILLGIKWLLKAHRLNDSAFNNVEMPVEVYGTFSGLNSKLFNKLDQEESNTLEAFIENGEVSVLRKQLSPNDPLDAIQFLIKDPRASNPEEQWINIPPSALKAIYHLFPKPIYVNSTDITFENDIKDFKLTTVGKLIGEIIKPVERKYSEQLISTIKKLEDIFDVDSKNRAPELNDFDIMANKNLEPLFPSMKVKLHVKTPQLSDIFKSGTLLAYESEDDIPCDVNNIGDGARRTIEMALVRQLSEVREKGVNDQSCRLLLIDSPELYLHPQAVELIRVSLKKLAAEGYQIIFATHSAQMVTSDEVGTSLLIRKTPNRGTFKRQRIEDAIKQVLSDSQSQLQMLFSLSNSNELLFAENVLLTEGKTELRILPHIFERITGKSFALIKCALIRQGGVSNTKKSMTVLDAMDLPSKAIVDLDFLFTTAIGHKLVKKKDRDLQILMDYLHEFAKVHKIRLVNGLPVNRSSSMSAATAYAKFAKLPQVKPHIRILHDRLLKHNIWLWTDGAIEEHLGLNGKNEATWAKFIADLKSKKLNEVVPDPIGVTKLCEWIANKYW